MVQPIAERERHARLRRTGACALTERKYYSVTNPSVGESQMLLEKENSVWQMWETIEWQLQRQSDYARAEDITATSH